MILYFIRWFFMQHYIFYRKIILAHPVSEMVFQIERLAILVTDSATTAIHTGHAGLDFLFRPDAHYKLFRPKYN